MTIKDLFMGYLGNGCTCCDKSRHEGGDYKRIAYISPAGNVTWYEQRAKLPEDVLRAIEQTRGTHRRTWGYYVDFMIEHHPEQMLEQMLNALPYEVFAKHASIKHENTRAYCEAVKEDYIKVS